MRRPYLRFALFVLVVLAAIPAATARAAQQMPIGFFDDPSASGGRPTRQENLADAASAGASVIHTTANWAAIAPTKPASASNPDDPAYQLRRPRRARRRSVPVRPARDDRHHRQPQVGERRPHAELHAEEALRLRHVRAHARHPLQRPQRRQGRGRAVVGLERAEPAAVPYPQYSGKKIVSPANYAKLFKAAYAAIKAANPQAKVADRRDVGPGSRQAAPGQERDGRARDVRQAALAAEGDQVRRVGASSVSDVSDLRSRSRRCATRT